MKLKINPKSDVKKSIKSQQPLADKAVRNMADSIYETLKQEGCENRDIIGVSTQLIGLVTSAMGEDSPKS